MRDPNPSHSFQIATWNVNFRRPSVLEALAGLQDRLDILTLQEVSLEQADAFRARLKDMRFSYVFYNGRAGVSVKRYGNIIACRWPLESVDVSQQSARFPWPQLVAHVIIEVGGCPVHIITAHIPNGAGNGWAKIDTFRALAELVLGIKGYHCILTGDFNEPQFAIQDGRIVTFGQEQNVDGRYACWGKWRFGGREGTGEQWDAAVRWLFQARQEHSLRPAYWDKCGPGAIEPTHMSRGSPRWFDHIFISDGLKVEACHYIHDARLNGLSDHSAMIAQLAYSIP